METGHHDTAKFARLNNPGRIEELRPAQLLKEIGSVTEGMTCVDMGSGTGVFSLPMVDLVGRTGTVHAVDTSTDMLDYIRAKDPSPNLRLVQADVGRTGLANGIADVCLLAFILHEVKAPEEVLTEAHRLLKHGGKVIIVEWSLESAKGPPLDIRIRRPKVERMLREAGLEVGEYVDWSRNHYVITGKKP